PPSRLVARHLARGKPGSRDVSICRPIRRFADDHRFVDHDFDAVYPASRIAGAPRLDLAFNIACQGDRSIDNPNLDSFGIDSRLTTQLDLNVVLQFTV